MSEHANLTVLTKRTHLTAQPGLCNDYDGVVTEVQQEESSGMVFSLHYDDIEPISMGLLRQ